MDVLTVQERHKAMSAVRSKNTKPEMLVRRYLWSHGFRYRVNSNRLPGHPDIVLRKYRTCVFVNGCFWHGHENCRFFKPPKSNIDFWRKKIARNRERDAEELHRLAVMGWHCIIVWECELRKGRRDETLESLVITLKHTYEEELCGTGVANGDALVGGSAQEQS